MTEKSKRTLGDEVTKVPQAPFVTFVTPSGRRFQNLNPWLGRLKDLQDKVQGSKKPLGKEVTKVPQESSTQPVARGVYEYRLTDSPSWLVFLAPPGVDLNNARRTLEAQFGEDRLVEVRPKRGTCGELPCAKDL